MIEAARFRLADVSIAEWAMTDAAWWHEMAQAMTAWRQGRAARQEMRQATPPDAPADAG